MLEPVYYRKARFITGGMTIMRVNLILVTILAVALFGCGSDDEGGGIPFRTGVMNEILEGSAGSMPSWSTDGVDIVYVALGSSGDQDLWIIPSEGGEPAELSAQPGRDLNPRWHPDSSKRQIIFLNIVTSTNMHTIYTLDVPGGEPTLVYQTDKDISYPSFSHDGSQVVFIGTGTKQELYKVPITGGEPVPIDNTEGWGRVVSAEASPTEGIIAFVQSKDSALNIYTISLDGGAPDKLTNFVSGGSGYMLTGQLGFLSFHKEGTQIVFTHSACYNCTSSALYFMAVTGGDPTQITEDPRTSAGAPRIYAPTMAPGGKKICAVQNSTLWIMEITSF
jgi:Tol biopolymer transport system component